MCVKSREGGGDRGKEQEKEKNIRWIDRIN